MSCKWMKLNANYLQFLVVELHQNGPHQTSQGLTE